jgi:hypothetical protein
MRMDLIRLGWLKLAPTAFFSLMSCASSPLDKEAGRASVEWQDGRYDGEQLSGRLLISAQAGSLRLDRRLGARAHVHVNAVSECDSGQPVPFVMADAISPPASKDDLLILAPGYWYGATVHFRLFSEHFTGRGPECVEAELTVLSFDGTPVGTVRARATGELDGSAPVSPSDAGVQRASGEPVPDSLVGSTLLGDPGFTPPQWRDGGTPLDGGSSPGTAR